MKKSNKKLLRLLVRQQRRTNKLLEEFANAFTELSRSAAIGPQHETLEIVELIRAELGDASSAASIDGTPAELRVRLDNVLLEQQRTNRLLELALRAGFDDEELLRER